MRRRLLTWLIATTALTACSPARPNAANSHPSPPTTSTTTTPLPPIVPAPRQRTYAVDGRAVALICRGRGRIPIIFQAGGTDRAVEWSKLVTALGPNVLTCVFDRPGVPPSAPLVAFTTPQAVARTLRATLALAHIGPRVILVGHSIGGIDSIAFGSAFPQQVVGAVLLDPTVPAFITTAEGRLEFAHFGFAADKTAAQLRAITGWPSVPMIVLAHDPAKAIADKTFTGAQQRIWTAGEQRYARLSPRGSYRAVPHSSHYIQEDAPDVALAAIRQELRTKR
jgi:pimeloyl-ACP methyl ester carboxylesterase